MMMQAATDVEKMAYISLHLPASPCISQAATDVEKMAELLHTPLEIVDHHDAVDLAQVDAPDPDPNPNPNPSQVDAPNPDPNPNPNLAQVVRDAPPEANPNPNPDPNPSPSPTQVVRDAPPKARDVRFDQVSSSHAVAG